MSNGVQNLVDGWDGDKVTIDALLVIGEETRPERAWRLWPTGPDLAPVALSYLSHASWGGCPLLLGTVFQEGQPGSGFGEKGFELPSLVNREGWGQGGGVRKRKQQIPGGGLHREVCPPLACEADEGGKIRVPFQVGSNPTDVLNHGGNKPQQDNEVGEMERGGFSCERLFPNGGRNLEESVLIGLEQVVTSAGLPGEGIPSLAEGLLEFWRLCQPWGCPCCPWGENRPGR